MMLAKLYMQKQGVSGMASMLGGGGGGSGLMGVLMSQLK
jgi:hypothetical protein